MIALARHTPTLPAAASRCLRAVSVFCLLLAGSTVLAAPIVAVSIKPLQHVVAAITQGVSEPLLVLDANQDPHNISLRPSERRALHDAALVLWIGPSLELPLAELLPQVPGKVLTVQDFDGLVLIGSGKALDPHLWLNTDNVRVIATTVARELGALDSANSARYMDNLKEFDALLQNTNGQISTVLAASSKQAWAVDHHAFRYLEQQFGLPAALQLIDSNNNAPGLRSARAFTSAMKKQGLNCIVTEPGVNPQELRAFLDNDHLVVERADILGVSIEVAADSYASLMLGVAQAIANCAGESHE
jgi:zinc transport system substrate-binding protein